MKKHQDMVRSLAKPGQKVIDELTPDKADATHMALGVCGEAGELADAIKKWSIYGKELDINNIVEELGDLEFYMERIRQIVGIKRDQTLRQNMKKLGERYAKFQYSNQQAIARKDKA